MASCLRATEPHLWGQFQRYVFTLSLACDVHGWLRAWTGGARPIRIRLNAPLAIDGSRSQSHRCRPRPFLGCAGVIPHEI
jgi:hypothetical protein